MSCDLVETRMRIRPRELEPLTPVHRGLVRTPIEGCANCSVARSSLRRRSRAACGHASRRTHRSSTRDACDQLSAKRHFDDGHPRFRSVIRWCVPLREALRMRGAFSRRPTRFGSSRCPAFRRGRFLPATSTDCASSDAPVTALRLSSGVSARERAGLSATGGDPPSRVGTEEVSASARPRPPAHRDP